MSVHRMIVKDDLLALVAAGYCHHILRGIDWLPSSQNSRAFWDAETDTFFVVLSGPVAPGSDGPTGDGRIACYHVGGHEVEKGHLSFEVLAVDMMPGEGSDPMVFDGVEVLDRLWSEEAMPDYHSVPPLDPDRQN